MSPKTRIILMFVPLVLFFAGLIVLVGDMRSPEVASDQCVITATGTDVQQPGRRSYIYRQSSNALNDVSMRCDRMGTLLLNDVQLFLTPVKAGQAANISRKRYQFLPDRWMVNVHTGPME